MSEQEYAEYESMIDAIEDEFDAEQEFWFGVEDDVLFA